MMAMTTSNSISVNPRRSVALMSPFTAKRGDRHGFPDFPTNHDSGQVEHVSFFRGKSEPVPGL